MTSRPSAAAPILRHANKVLAALAITILAGFLYGGSYLAMLIGKRQFAVQDDDPIAPTVSIRSVPRYRVNWSIIPTIFQPANAIDAMLRPEMWKELPIAPMWHNAPPDPPNSFDPIPR
jgi:hypothetical protein